MPRRALGCVLRLMQRACSSELLRPLLSTSALRADAGMCARRRSHFHCAANESNQSKAAPAACVPLNFALAKFKRATCECSGVACTVKLTASQRLSVQTDTVSQSTKQLHSAVQLPAHALCSSAHAKGVGATNTGIASLWASAAHGADALLLFYKFDSCWRAPDARQRLKSP